MKKTLSAALIAATLAQPVLAEDTRHTADRKDVAQAQSDADNMSALDAIWLKSRAFVYEIVLAELHFNQTLMDKVGVEHNRNAKTIAFGLPRAALSLAAGAYALRYATKGEIGAYDKELTTAYSVIADKRRELKAAKLELDRSVGKINRAQPPELTPDQVGLQTRVSKLRDDLHDMVANVKVTESRQTFTQRELRTARRLLLPILGTALVLDGVSSLAQIVVDPAGADDLEARLTRFVDDANDTLARR